MKNKSIKLATFNLFNYLQPPNAYYDFENIYTALQWQKKQSWLEQTLMKMNADVIGFQEVFSVESLRQQVKACGYSNLITVDEPKVEGDFIYKAPVVAIASKYPIVEVQNLSIDSKLVKQMKLNRDFCFSRKIVRATIDLPVLGFTDVYVCHLKSKRGIEADTEAESEVSILQQQICGRWHSAMQRGSEATLLMCAIIEQRHKTGRPVVVMGDLNSTLTDSVLQAIDFNQLDQNGLSSTHFAIYDSWDLFRQTNHYHTTLKRAATHYYKSKGSVLDYILLSSEFAAKHPLNFVDVCAYQTLDKHVINPAFDREDKSSDHGIVMVTLSPRC